jgi:hypothetical protein
MILLRQKTYASAASFKPKFRKRFRNGDFSYVQAKNPAYEALNHQAYKEVACEDEFKNNPETYKIRQGLFSEISEEDKKKLKRARNINLAGAAVSEAGLLTDLGIDINRLRHGREITSPVIPLAASVPFVATSVYDQLKIKKMYKKYHPEVKNPTQKELRRWAIEEVGLSKGLLDMTKQKKEIKEGKK